MNHPRTLVRYAGLGAVATLTAALTGLAPAEASPYFQPSAHVVGRTLVVAGTFAADDAVLTFPADGSAASVTFSGYRVGRNFARSDFDRVLVSLGNGADHFRVVPGATGTDAPVAVYGGNGDDVLQGGNGNDTLYGGRGDDFVDGVGGVDTEVLGQGDDTALWVPGEASDVVVGGSGSDTLDFVGGAGIDVMTLDVHGQQSVLFREPGSIRMDLDSVEVLGLRPLAGADRLTINGTDAPESVAVTDVYGVIEVSGLLPKVDVIGPEPADRLQVNTLGGHDSVTVGAGVDALITTSFDLGTGQ